MQKRPFTGLLRKSIRLDDAKPGWLKASFGLPRDTDDLKAFDEGEFKKRFVELDKFFEITSNSADIWEQRAKALVAYEFGVEPSGTGWWKRFALYLVTRYVPGFKIKQIDQRKSGRPRDDERFAQLFADVEYQKRKTGLSVSNICEKLPTKRGYEERWGRYRGATLRKIYLDAKKRRKNYFEVYLYGENAAYWPSGFDRIEAAIERHALRI